MKRVLFIFIALVFITCKKDDEEETFPRVVDYPLWIFETAWVNTNIQDCDSLFLILDGKAKAVTKRKIGAKATTMEHGYYYIIELKKSIFTFAKAQVNTSIDEFPFTQIRQDSITGVKGGGYKRFDYNKALELR